MLQNGHTYSINLVVLIRKIYKVCLKIFQHCTWQSENNFLNGRNKIEIPEFLLFSYVKF